MRKFVFGFILFFLNTGFAQLTCSPNTRPARGNVLLIGDSHTASASEFGTLQSHLAIGPNGRSCNQNIPGSCAQVTRCARSGITAYDILQQRENDQLFQQNPAAVVIALGTNDAGWVCNETDTTRGRWTSIRNLIRKVPAGTPCFWIGPPNFPESSSVMRTCENNYRRYIERLRQEVIRNNCRYIDSTQMKTVSTPNAQNPCSDGTQPLSPDASRDRLHPHGDVARNWARCSAQQISQLLSSQATPQAQPPVAPAPRTNPQGSGFRLQIRRTGGLE